jgi:uncharacterized protein YeaO (DUF488 family)
MVKTKSVYDPVEESDGDRILVTRYRPRGILKTQLSITDWLRNLAPSKKLLHDWKEQSISWQQYSVRYHEEMAGEQKTIRELAKKAKGRTITLLCFEREDNPHCHRHLLKKLVENEQPTV